MNLEIKQAILEKIKAYPVICLFRHVRNDGDCVGATKGFKRILQLSFPEKEIYLIDHETAQYLEFMGPEDPEIDDSVYSNALAIVLDTGSEARISNKKYTLCKELIKIDHHIPLDNYGDLQWVEEDRSSCCEMIVDFYETFRDELVLNSAAATHLYTGMVTDSGRFKYEGVTGDTMRYAGVLLDVGVDTDTLFARLYLEAFEYLKFKAYIYEHMQVTENGVAYIVVDKAMQERFGSVIGRPHFGLVLMDLGLVQSIDEAFDRYLEKGRKYYMPRSTLSLEDSLSLIRRAGGVAVLAHPFQYRLEDAALRELIAYGMDHGLAGIECRYSGYSPEQCAYLETLAEEYGLLKTGGSDFHGSNKPHIRLGSGKHGELSVPYEFLRHLKESHRG